MTQAGRVILITGAGSGIGAALALEYAAVDGLIILLGRNQEKLDIVAEACRARGAETRTIAADVSDIEQLRSLLFALDDEAPIDLLIANAGVTSGVPQGQLLEPWDGIREIAGTNFTGVLATVAPICERMVGRGHGQIAVTGSISAYRGLPSSPAYCAAKAGIEAYAMALRSGLADKGVQVNVISPGYVETGISDRLTGPKPFQMTAASAARIIRAGLQKNRARISFPLPTALGMRLLSLMPERLARLFMPCFAFTVDRDPAPDRDEAARK